MSELPLSSGLTCPHASDDALMLECFKQAVLGMSLPFTHAGPLPCSLVLGAGTWTLRCRPALRARLTWRRPTHPLWQQAMCRGRKR